MRQALSRILMGVLLGGLLSWGWALSAQTEGFPFENAHLYVWDGAVWYPGGGQTTGAHPITNAHMFIWTGSAWTPATSLTVSDNPPGGADTQVQVNDGGVFGGDSTFTFDKGTKALLLSGITSSGNSVVSIGPTTNTGSGLVNIGSIDDMTVLDYALQIQAQESNAAAGAFEALNASAVSKNATGTMQHVAGIDGSAALNAAGTVTDLIGGSFSAYQSTGTVTNAVSLKVLASSVTSASNVYGLLVNDQSGGTANYAIKTGLGLVSFGDAVSTGGASPAVANVGANSCGTTAASIAGNDNAGTITVGATSASQCRVTFVKAATNRRECTVTDETTTIATRASYVDVSNTDLLGSFGAGDLVSYVCFAR